MEKSYEQLSIVNQPPESPRLLARADRGGNVLFLADVNGDGACIRVQVLTPHGALDRDKQRDAVARLTTLVATSSAVPPDRVGVRLTEATEGGWGIGGHALGAEDIAAVVNQG